MHTSISSLGHGVHMADSYTKIFKVQTFTVSRGIRPNINNQIDMVFAPERVQNIQNTLIYASALFGA